MYQETGKCEVVLVTLLLNLFHEKNKISGLTTFLSFILFS